MLNLIREWAKTATKEELIELQDIASKATPHDIIVRTVIGFINEGYTLRAIEWIKDTKGVTLKEARDIVNKMKYHY